MLNATYNKTQRKMKFLLILLRVFQLLLVLVISATPSHSMENEKQFSPESFVRQLQGSNVDFSCNVQADNCGSKFNGECENNEPGCQDGDCWDCNLCRQFDYDCGSCLEQTGCVWCPGDATCLNSVWYVAGPCGREDYTEDSCDTIGDTNFFEYVHHAMQSKLFSLHCGSDESKERVVLTFSWFLLILKLLFQ
jgi:hypothetical protein